MDVAAGPTTEQRRQALLQAMGIDVWVPRAAATATVSITPDEAPAQPAIDAVATDAVWDNLRSAVAACTACELHRERTQTVFGVGDRQASVLVIGEAPGAEEDRRGEPFVGRAGQLLNAMLAAVGLARESVYIANILKCRPPRNRDPQADEVASCSAFLARQIALVQPRVILAVGRIAAQNLLACDTPIGRLRGQLHHFGERRIPVMVTYHPAYLLRSPAEKRKVWADLQSLARLLEGQPS